MLKVAFPSFKISKFSGGEFPQNPLQVSISCACSLAPQIQNTLHRPCSHRLSLWKWPLSIRSWQLLEKVLTGCTVRQIWFDTTFKYKALNYSHARWSVPPKNTLMNLLSKVESVASCRFQIDLRILACIMSSEFTRKAVMKFLPAQFSWIWCKCLLRNLIHSKIFNLTKYREVLVKYSLLITHAEMLLWIWHQLQERLTDSFFK